MEGGRGGRSGKYLENKKRRGGVLFEQCTEQRHRNVETDVCHAKSPPPPPLPTTRRTVRHPGHAITHPSLPSPTDVRTSHQKRRLCNTHTHTHTHTPQHSTAAQHSTEDRATYALSSVRPDYCSLRTHAAKQSLLSKVSTRRSHGATAHNGRTGERGIRKTDDGIGVGIPASDNSIGSSGGTTEVQIIMQFNTSL